MIVIYLIVGAFAGMMSGLFGIGGGAIIIPALATIFMHYSLFPSTYIMQMAVGTSLAIIIVTSASSLYAHQKLSGIIWPVVWRMMPGLMIGAIVGVIGAQFIPSNYLRFIFSIFLIMVGVKLILNQSEVKAVKHISEHVMKIGSIIIGILSSILGLAGGILLVPFFLRYQLDTKHALGTSIACGLGVSIVATIGFMITGLLWNVNVPWSTGYIYWPAFLGIAPISVLFASVGVKLGHKLPGALLKRIFGVFLLMMAVNLMFRGNVL